MLRSNDMPLWLGLFIILLLAGICVNIFVTAPPPEIKLEELVVISI